MGKVLTLIFMILLALVSVGGYLFLDKEITAAESRIAVGQGQLKKGYSDLNAGKARLKAGKQEVSQNKKWFGLADKLLDGGRDFKRAGKLIDDRGNKQVADGEKQVDDGERRLNAGELNIRRGREQLSLAKNQRLACALAAAFFTFLSVVLGFFWRRSLVQAFM